MCMENDVYACFCCTLEVFSTIAIAYNTQNLGQIIDRSNCTIGCNKQCTWIITD